MLLSVKDQGLGRKRRSYSHGSVYSNKPGKSSKLSLLSAITTQSSGSNESNSTVTQDSYNNSKSDLPRRRKSSRRRKESVSSRAVAMEAVEEGSTEDDAADEKVDVFAYLVDEDGQRVRKERPESSRHRSQEPDPGPYPEEAIHEDDQEHDHDYATHSFHSDSGISMDDGTFVIGKTTLQPLISRPSLDNRHCDDDDDDYRSQTSRRRIQWNWPDVPKPRHQAVARREPAIVEATKEEHDEEHDNDSDDHDDSEDDEDHDDSDHHEDDHEDHEDHDFHCPTPPPAFVEDYPDFPLSTDHLASELADAASPPLFKSFKKTNYRILLQLQDEITELQDDLAHLDTFDGSRRLKKSAHSSDRLRRLSWQWGQRDFDLYAAKAEVMGKLQVRMDQYYGTLSLSQKVHRMQCSSHLDSNDVGRYRIWLDNHLRVSGSSKSDSRSEHRFGFLDDEKDLITFRPDSSANSTMILHPICLFTLLVPLLLFKISTGILNRIIIVGLTLALGLFVSNHSQFVTILCRFGGKGSAEMVKNMQYGLIVCAGISVVVGLLF